MGNNLRLPSPSPKRLMFCRSTVRYSDNLSFMCGQLLFPTTLKFRSGDTSGISCGPFPGPVIAPKYGVDRSFVCLPESFVIFIADWGSDTKFAKP